MEGNNRDDSDAGLSSAGQTSGGGWRTRMFKRRKTEPETENVSNPQGQRLHSQTEPCVSSIIDVETSPPEAPAPNQRLESMIKAMNEAVCRLQKVISVFDRTSDPKIDLPILTSKENLDENLRKMEELVASLLKIKLQPHKVSGVFPELGYVLEAVCRHVTPFLKNFLAVAIQGSPVRIFNLPF
jgi:hypothetical protein